MELIYLWAIWKCLAESTLSGNYSSAPCYDVPPEISDALVIVAQFIAGLLGY